MSEFTDEQIEAETDKMVEGQIAEHLETLRDRDCLVPHDIEDAYGSWQAVTHAARAAKEAPAAVLVWEIDEMEGQKRLVGAWEPHDGTVPTVSGRVRLVPEEVL